MAIKNILKILVKTIIIIIFAV